jgi:hypothetical protein
MELHVTKDVTRKTVTATVIRPAVMKLPVMEFPVAKTAVMVYAGRLAVSEPAVKQIVTVNVTRQPVMLAMTELVVTGPAVKSPVPNPAVKATVKATVNRSAAMEPGAISPVNRLLLMAAVIWNTLKMEHIPCLLPRVTAASIAHRWRALKESTLFRLHLPANESPYRLH